VHTAAIKQELKATFPNVKFSVRKSASGGSINIKWENLPSVKAVNAIVKKYENVSYDQHSGEVLSGGNTFVFTSAEFTPEFKTEVEARMPEYCLESHMYYWRVFSDVVNQMWEEQSTVSEVVEVVEVVTPEVVETVEAIEVEAVEATQTTPEPTTTIPVQSITFKWSESSLINDNTTVTTFADANSLIHSIASNMFRTNEQGYTKTAFVITWEDGRTHEGRIDVTPSFINKHNPIGEHVRYFLEGLAGLKKPSNWTQEEYINNLKNMYKIDTQEMEEIKQVLSTYLLDDVQGVTPVTPEVLLTPEVVATQTVIINTTPEATQASSDVAQLNEPTTIPVINGSAHNVTVTYNDALNGIELTFENELSPTEMTKIKSHGFRWSHRKQLYYAKQSDKTINFANSLNPELNNNDSANTVTPTRINSEPITYPSIEIDDLHLYTVSDELQRRLHSASMFEVDYKKECTNIFRFIQDAAYSVINLTDIESMQYQVKKYLQSYKKRYYDQYIKVLTHKANNPSWAITGRGGMNVSRYNKMQDRYGNMISTLSELSNEYNKRISKFKSQIHKHEQDIIKQEINNITETAEFKTDKKEICVAGYKETKRVYIYNKFMIARAWGCFRIFHLNGKEINSNLKTTSKLDEAKQFVLYLDKKEQAV